jgi:UDPglucose 6-dehydrogenase
MRISVIGCGYLGTVHAACLAAWGHDVIGIDVDAVKTTKLSAGEAPFFEPGLSDLLAAGVASGRLRFSTDVADAADCEVHFITVGTPQHDGSNEADMTFVDAAFASLLPHTHPGQLIVGKSTVPVGTAERLSAALPHPGPELAWNPEFLREGHAVQDTMSPDRLVYGIRAGNDTTEAVLDEVYAPAIAASTPKVVTDFATAELVKVAANAFLATKISFINAIAEVAEATGADVTRLADALGHDARIGRRFLNAGLGFGGGCLPKDIRAFMSRADELGATDLLGLLHEVDEINLRRRARMVELVTDALEGDLRGKRIAVLGLAFKPESDDIRDSPALDVAERLRDAGALVVATDPHAVEKSREQHPALSYAVDAESAATDADAVLLLTEWQEFRDLDPTSLDAQVAHRLIIDGRNALDPRTWRSAGWTYRAFGRP